MEQPATIPTTFTFQNHLITGDILSKVQLLHLKILGTSNLQAILNTMQVLRDDQPKEYAESIQYIDRTHDFLFDYPAKISPKIYENLKGLQRGAR